MKNALNKYRISLMLKQITDIEKYYNCICHMAYMKKLFRIKIENSLILFVFV